jgi:hypothetical protein
MQALTVPPEAHSSDPVDLLYMNILETLTPRYATHLKLFMATITRLALRDDINKAPGRRWSKKKAIDLNCKELIELIAHLAGQLDKNIPSEEREAWYALLSIHQMGIGEKGKDTFRRTLYCLYTPKGSIPLDQPLGGK